MSARVESLLADLIMALQAQTEALNQLVISNMAMVDAMTEGGDNEDGHEQGGAYLDGTPR